MIKAPIRFAILALVLSPGTASSQSAPVIHQLQYDETTDIAVTAVGGTVWIMSELFKGSLAPSSCRWCDRNADGTDAINGVDSWFRQRLKWERPDTADTVSNVTAFGVSPLLAFGLDALAASHDHAERGFAVDALLIAEATILAGDLNQVVKFAAGRERPFVHALAGEDKSRTAHPADNNVSFFSGHTTLGFALATSSGTIASMRGYRLAPLVWAISLPVASVSGYLRIAADRHYFTDVVTGALVGSAIGFAVPLLLHPPRPIDTGTAVALDLDRLLGERIMVMGGFW